MACSLLINSNGKELVEIRNTIMMLLKFCEKKKLSGNFASSSGRSQFLIFHHILHTEYGCKCFFLILLLLLFCLFV